MGKKNEKVLMHYKCRWCGHEFDQRVGTSNYKPDKLGRVPRHVSDQVKCPKCTNFLKTYGD